MATTHLALAKHLQLRTPVQVEDIKVGLKIEYPSGTGGSLTYKCVAMDDHQAEFKSTNKDWPYSFTMKLNHPEFTLEQFNSLALALEAYGSWKTIPTDEQRAIVHEAHLLGYARVLSGTQAHWTDEGIKAFRALQP